MKLILSTIVVALLIMASSCKNRKESIKGNQAGIPTSILSDNFDEYRNTAATTISSASIAKNTLSISVSYSGGCEKHDFSLIGSNNLLKSLPPKRGVMLYHNNNGDSCRELIDTVLLFNIRNLAYENQEVILMLEGYDSTLSYTPVD